MRTFICVWCQLPKHKHFRTKEHLRPKMLGGKGGEDNIRYACEKCNLNRSLLTSTYSNQLSLSRLCANWDKMSDDRRAWLLKCLRRFACKLPKILVLQEKWVALEMERLGYAPSESMKFSLPQVKDAEQCVS